MTNKQVFDLIRQLGLCVQYRDGEWKINYRYPRGQYRESTAYYTNDKKDAIATAFLMSGFSLGE